MVLIIDSTLVYTGSSSCVLTSSNPLLNLQVIQENISILLSLFFCADVILAFPFPQSLARVFIWSTAFTCTPDHCTFVQVVAMQGQTWKSCTIQIFFFISVAFVAASAGEKKKDLKHISLYIYSSYFYQFFQQLNNLSSYQVTWQKYDLETLKK